jgi:hypothetical protein
MERARHAQDKDGARVAASTKRHVFRIYFSFMNLAQQLPYEWKEGVNFVTMFVNNFISVGQIKNNLFGR